MIVVRCQECSWTGLETELNCNQKRDETCPKCDSTRIEEE